MFYMVLEGSRGFQGDFKSWEVLWREGRRGRRARTRARRRARRWARRGQEGGQEGGYEGGEEGEAGMAEKRRKAHIVGLYSRLKQDQNDQ